MSDVKDCIQYVLEVQEDEELKIKPGNHDLVEVRIYKRYPKNITIKVNSLIANNVRIVSENSKTKIYVMKLRERDEQN